MYVPPFGLRSLLTATLAATLLAACGGGSDNDSPASFASGAWQGTSDSGRDVSGVVLQNGTYYLLYSVPGAAATPGGFVQGTGGFEGATFVSGDLRDYNVEGTGVQQGSLTAEVRPTRSLRASIATPRAPQVFDTQAATDFARASLETLAGSYTGQVAFSLGRRPATFVVTPTGQVSSTINACDIGGRVSPRPEGNVYDLTVVFGGAPCVFPNATFTGVAFVRGTELRGLVQDGSRRQGIVFAGTRQ